MIDAKMEMAMQNIKDGIAQKAILEGQLAIEEQELKAEIALLTEQLRAKTESTRNAIKDIATILKVIKEGLVEQWPTDVGKQIKDTDGWTFTLKSTRGIEVTDEKLLLQLCVVMPTPPLKAKWDNRKLITLLEAGAIDPELAEVTVSHYLAITQPKK